MVRSIALGLALASAALWAIGCGGLDRFPYNGEWRGQRVLVGLEGDTSTEAKTLMTVRLKIDGERFELFDQGIPQAGTIHYESDQLLLDVRSRFERPVEDSKEEEGPEFKIKPVNENRLDLTDVKTKAILQLVRHQPK